MRLLMFYVGHRYRCKSYLWVLGRSRSWYLCSELIYSIAVEETIAAFTFSGLFPSFAQKIEIILNGDVNDRETLQSKLTIRRGKNNNYRQFILRWSLLRLCSCSGRDQLEVSNSSNTPGGTVPAWRTDASCCLGTPASTTCQEEEVK